MDYSQRGTESELHFKERRKSKLGRNSVKYGKSIGRGPLRIETEPNSACKI